MIKLAVVYQIISVFSKKNNENVTLKYASNDCSLIYNEELKMVKI